MLAVLILCPDPSGQQKKGVRNLSLTPAHSIYHFRSLVKGKKHLLTKGCKDSNSLFENMLHRTDRATAPMVGPIRPDSAGGCRPSLRKENKHRLFLLRITEGRPTDDRYKTLEEPGQRRYAETIVGYCESLSYVQKPLGALANGIHKRSGQSRRLFPLSVHQDPG